MSEFTPSETWKHRESSHVWGRETHTDNVEYILHGRLDNLPPAKSNVVRVFLSSTFTDMSVERNTLMKTTFPKLKSILREKYGLEFQVVDMRWGVRNEATDDHSASQLCMRELSMCQKLSVGPTFVTFLGQRYGSRPLPTKIPKQEMDKILACLEDPKEIPGVNQESLETRRSWYREDQNAVPPEYLLQPISCMTEDEKYEKYKSEPQKLWKYAEPILGNTLRTAAHLLKTKEDISDYEMQKYIQSVTDEEIQRGLIEDPDPDTHCLCFIRTLHNINHKHPKAWRFIDQINSGDIDTDAQDCLNTLKEESIPSCLSKNNIHRFNVEWSDNKGVNEQEHGEYLKEFCQTFENSIMQLITQGVRKTEEVSKDQLYVEVLEHAHQCVNKCERFFGRDDILSSIRAYIMSDSDQPLVIKGESGCGKTSVMAKASQLTPGWIGDDRNLTVVLRFLGTTPFSSSIGTTLTSVCNQVHRAMDLPEKYKEAPPQFADLKDFFWDLLDNIPENKLLVLYLDSLDQLASADNAYGMKWLPKNIPSRVKIILSTLPSEHDILQNLEYKQIPESHFVDIGDFESADSIAIIKLWLEQQSRHITSEQLNSLEKVLETKQRPLYLKLIFDKVSTWKSYQSACVSETFPASIEEAIVQLFTYIEKKHGLCLASRAFGYLSASKNGLTETEMEDVLSLDDDVLKDVFEFHIPPVRRLPSILWSRIRADVSEYIVDREAGDAKVMAWYHRQFKEKAKRYFNRDDYWLAKSSDAVYTQEDREAILQNMLDYFAGTYSNGKLKPFTYTAKQMKKLNLSQCESQADRYVPNQPCFYYGDDIENIRHNKRKVSELPFILQQMDNIPGKKMEMLLFNAEFLSLWFANGTWSEMTNYFERDMVGDDNNVTARRECSLMHKCLFLSYTTFYDNPLMTGACIAGRMLPYLNCMPNFTKFIESSDTKGLRLCGLVPPHTNLEAPGGELWFMINNHHDCVNDCFFSENSETFISVSSKIVIVNLFVLDMGQICADFRPRSIPGNNYFKHVTEVKTGIISKFIIASLSETPWLYVFDPKDGQILHEYRLNRYKDLENFRVDGIIHAAKLEMIFVWSKASNRILKFSRDCRLLGKLRFEALVEFVGYMKFVFVVKLQNNPNIFIFGKRLEKRATVVLESQKDLVVSHFSAVGPILLVVSEEGELFKVDLRNVKMESDGLISAIPVPLPEHYSFTPHCFKVYDPIVAVCVKDLLICFTIEYNKDDGCEKVSKLLQIKKHYDGLTMNDAWSFLYAYKGGTIDIFAVEPHEGRWRAKLFRSIDAHAAPITKIFTWPTYLNEYIFVSAAKDGSLKFWSLLRSKNSQFLPAFDRAKTAIQDVLTFGDETHGSCYALATLQGNGSGNGVNIWDVLHGEKLCTLHQGDMNKFVGHTVLTKGLDTPLTYITAIHQSGPVISWNITEALQSISKGEGGVLPEPQLCDSLPSEFCENMFQLVAFGDGSKALAVSKQGECYVVDSFQTSRQHTKPLRCADQEGMEVTKVERSHDENIVMFKQSSEKGLSVLVFDCCKGMEVGVVNLTAKFQQTSILDYAYISARNCVCLLTKQNGFEISLYCLDEGKVTFTDHLPTEPAKHNSLVTANVCVAINLLRSIHILDTRKQFMSYSRKVERDISHMCLTPDGEYLLYLLNSKELYLLRTSNGAVLARYTMYAHVTSLSTSSNSWYVIMGTTDRRLFVLTIVDPDVPAHRERIEVIRRANQGMDKEHLSKMMEEFERHVEETIEVDGDASSVIDMAEVEMRRALSRHKSKFTSDIRNVMKQIDPADQLTEDGDDMKRSQEGRMSRQGSQIVQQPLVMTTELCSLQ